MSPASSIRVVSCALLLSLATTGELKLRESDHAVLSRKVGAYFSALQEEKGIFQSLQEVVDQIEATEKAKLKGGKLLAAVADWEEIFRIVNEGLVETTLKKKGEVTSVKLKSDSGIEVNLAYCVPKKAPKGALPLILIACDGGESPSSHLNAIWNDTVVREGAILVAIDLGKDTQSWGVFGSPTAPGGAYQVMTALSLVQREFAVDCNRRFLVGSGKGFAAVEATAATYPQVFAGVIGIGDVSMTDAGHLQNFRSLPTLLLKGGEGAKALAAKLEENGFSNCTQSLDGGATQAWEWMGGNRRISYPSHISFFPKSDNARVAHWISLVGFQSAENPRIDAKADRASNTITIDAEKIADLVIFLNDELVDLDKPVRFVINGAIHEQTVARNAPEMIKNQFNWGDWGRVFTASVAQSVPPK